MFVRDLDTGTVYAVGEVYKHIRTGLDPSFLDDESLPSSPIAAEGAADVGGDDSAGAACQVRDLNSGTVFPLYEIQDRVKSGVEPSHLHHDIVIDALGRQFRVHKQVLMKSPYFHAMLTGGWKEAGAKRLFLVIEDPNINIDAISAIIDYLYNEHSADVRLDNQFQLLAAASMFQVDKLAHKCVECIISNLCADTFIDAAEFALHYSQNELLSECLFWLKSNMPVPGFAGFLQRRPVSRRLSLARASSEDPLLLDGNTIKHNDRVLDFDVFHALVDSERTQVVAVERPLPVSAGTNYTRGLVQCYIKRVRVDEGDRSQTVFRLFLQKNDKEEFLLAARLRPQDRRGSFRRRGTEFIISSSDTDIAMHNKHYLGTLSCSLLGTNAVLHDKGINPDELDMSLFPPSAPRKEIVSISYQINLFGGGPRKLSVVVPPVEQEEDGSPSNPEQLVPVQAGSRSRKLLQRPLMSRYKDGKNKEGLVAFQNKPPVWNDRLNAFCLNFSGRVKMASKKNFQIVLVDGPPSIVLQFGKVDKETFVLDYKHPLSCVQAFGIALSSFGKKVLVM